MPKISVIIPVYNVEKYLNRCVESILNQTFKNFELILIDDGSPDNCPAICDEYAAKYDFIHVIHKQNGGQGEARNFGIDWAFKNSDSEYIAFVDSDDWIHKKRFEILINSLKRYNLKICCSKGMLVREKIPDKQIKSFDLIIASPEELFINNLLSMTVPWVGIFDKQLFKNARFPVGKIHEDEFLIPFILYSCKKIGFVDIALYYYYVNPTSTTHLPKTAKAIHDQLEGILLQIDYFSKTMFEKTFNARVKGFKAIVSQYFEDYGRKKTYRKILKHQINLAKAIVEKNAQKIQCYDTKKYTFKKWVIGFPEKMNELKQDIQAVKSEKGRIYAFFWGIFNYIKIKWLMRI